MKTLLFNSILILIPLAIAAIIYIYCNKYNIIIKFKINSIIVIIGIIVYILIMTILSILKVESLRSGGDVGIYSNILWNSSKGKLYETTILNDGSILGQHVSIIPLLLTPMYSVFQSYIIMYIIQTSMLAVGAWAVYGIFCHLTKSNHLGILFAFVYLTSPFLHWINLSEFHLLSFIVPFGLFTILQMLRKKWLMFWIFFTILIMTREDGALLGAIIGCYLLLFSKEKVQGLCALIMGAMVFLTDMYLIIPGFHHSEAKFFEERFIGGNTMISVIFSPITHTSQFLSVIQISDKWYYYLHYLMSMGFLPLLGGSGLLLLVEPVYFTLLSIHPNQYGMFRYYNAIYLPGLYLATALGLARLLIWLKRKNHSLTAFKCALAVYLITITLIIGRWFGPLPIGWGKYFKIEDYSISDRRQVLQELIERIPDDSSVYVSDNLTVFLSNRFVIHNSVNTMIDSCLDEYIILDMLYDGGLKMHDIIKSNHITNDYQILYCDNNFYLYKRNN